MAVRWARLCQGIFRIIPGTITTNKAALQSTSMPETRASMCLRQLTHNLSVSSNSLWHWKWKRPTNTTTLAKVRPQVTGTSAGRVSSHPVVFIKTLLDLLSMRPVNLSYPQSTRFPQFEPQWGLCATNNSLERRANQCLLGEPSQAVITTVVTIARWTKLLWATRLKSSSKTARKSIQSTFYLQ